MNYPFSRFRAFVPKIQTNDSDIQLTEIYNLKICTERWGTEAQLVIADSALDPQPR